jgi:hypothetical protein
MSIVSPFCIPEINLIARTNYSLQTIYTRIQPVTYAILDQLDSNNRRPGLNPAVQRTAGRCDASSPLMNVFPLQFVLARAGGR